VCRAAVVCECVCVRAHAYTCVCACVRGGPCPRSTTEGRKESARAAEGPTRSVERLRQVVACFSTAKTARLACVNRQGVVEGVVTLTDLFKYLAGG
jgi:hypothetical protein